MALFDAVLKKDGDRIIIEIPPELKSKVEHLVGRNVRCVVADDRTYAKLSEIIDLAGRLNDYLKMLGLEQFGLRPWDYMVRYLFSSIRCARDPSLATIEDVCAYLVVLMAEKAAMEILGKAASLFIVGDLDLRRVGSIHPGLATAVTLLLVRGFREGLVEVCDPFWKRKLTDVLEKSSFYDIVRTVVVMASYNRSFSSTFFFKFDENIRDSAQGLAWKILNLVYLKKWFERTWLLEVALRNKHRLEKEMAFDRFNDAMQLIVPDWIDEVLLDEAPEDADHDSINDIREAEEESQKRVIGLVAFRDETEAIACAKIEKVYGEVKVKTWKPEDIDIYDVLAGADYFTKVYKKFARSIAVFKVGVPTEVERYIKEFNDLVGNLNDWTAIVLVDCRKENLKLHMWAIYRDTVVLELHV